MCQISVKNNQLPVNEEKDLSVGCHDSQRNPGEEVGLQVGLQRLLDPCAGGVHSRLKESSHRPEWVCLLPASELMPRQA